MAAAFSTSSSAVNRDSPDLYADRRRAFRLGLKDAGIAKIIIGSEAIMRADERPSHDAADILCGDNMSAWVSDLKGNCPKRDAAGLQDP